MLCPEVRRRGKVSRQRRAALPQVPSRLLGPAVSRASGFSSTSVNHPPSPSCLSCPDLSANMRSAGRNAPMAPRCGRRRLTPSPPVPPTKGLRPASSRGRRPDEGPTWERTLRQPPPARTGSPWPRFYQSSFQLRPERKDHAHKNASVHKHRYCLPPEWPLHTPARTRGQVHSCTPRVGCVNVPPGHPY